MSIDRLQEISRATGSDATLQLGEANRGIFWQSHHQLSDAVDYEVELPAGLHLACGLATLDTASPGLGGFTLAGSGLTAVLAPADTARARTRVAAGGNRSCGLFVPADHLQDIRVERLARQLRRGQAMRACTQAPRALLERLCTPLDRWFQGHARSLAMEARALELMALALTWLDEEKGENNGPVSPPLRHATHAARTRQILEERLQSPPSLAALAREVGLNVHALTDAFRAAHGTSIASYVSLRRLQVARDCLLQGMCVSAAAYHVGYTPAHFSNAFQRQYGVRPQVFVQGQAHR